MLISKHHQETIKEKWQTLEYYYKYLFYMILGIIFSSLTLPFMFFNLLMFSDAHYKNNMLACSIHNWCNSKLHLKWSLRGSENAIRDGGAVIVINHQSFLDALCKGYRSLETFLSDNITLKHLIERKVFTHFIMKKELWYIFPLGLFLWFMGSVTIDRSNHMKGIDVLKSLSFEIVNNKIRVMIYPEGTRHGGDKLLPFKKGAFHLAINAQVPILPIVVQKYKFLDHKKKKFTSGHTWVSILPQIPTCGLQNEDVDDLMKKAYTMMSKEYEALNSLD